MIESTSTLAATGANELLRVAETIELGSVRVPLLGSSNLWIEDSLAGSASIRLAQSIIQSALEGTAPGQLEVIVFDDALSGLASPFSPLNSGGEKVLKLLHDEQDFKATLRQLRDHVQAVKSVMRGQTPSLVEFRRQVDYPVESYKLVVVSTDVSFLDDHSQAQLAVLMKAGPAAGVCFLVHSMTLGVNKFLVMMCEYLSVKPPGVIERDGGHLITDWTPPLPTQLTASSEQVANTLAAASMAPIAFTAVQEVAHRWQHTSVDGVTFAVGRYGDETVEVTLGDELNQRHNMLITGAVGQGKSNLISVVIHSLCQRYSPREVTLYLMDFKEGVSLQPLFSDVTGHYLPHACMLGLDADPEFGHSLLTHLHQIYRNRMKMFKGAGVQNLRQFRLAYPDVEMPRLVVIIDEFQMMFAERDRSSDEVAGLLVRGMRLFRACGIHIILASQTIGGNVSLMGAAGDGMFAQIPVRIALKNSLAEARATLGDRNDAAAYLRAREAIVNHDYGDFAANRKTTIAFADEHVLSALRSSWWRDARHWTRRPYIFRGEARRSTADDLDRLRELRRARARTLLLGARIEVDAQSLEVPFGREVGRNVALIGSGDAVPVIENLMLALSAQAPQTRFVVLDLLDGNAAWDSSRQVFIELMRGLASDVQLIGKADVFGFLADLAQELSGREDAADVVIVGLGLDRCRAMPTEFQDIVKLGPLVGIHIVGWWLKLDSFRAQVGYGGDSFFDIRLALRLDVQSAKQLMTDPLLEWRMADNRMLAWDATELSEPVRVVPYTVLDPRVLDVLDEPEL